MRLSMSDNNNEDIELQRLRMERMQKILQQKEETERRAAQHILTFDEKVDRLLSVLLLPNAWEYFQTIKKNQPQAYQFIRNAIFPQEIAEQIDMLMNYLERGMIRRGLIPISEIQYLEREALGIGPRISVKKQGKDWQSIGSFLKEED